MFEVEKLHLCQGEKIERPCTFVISTNFMSCGNPHAALDVVHFCNHKFCISRGDWVVFNIVSGLNSLYAVLVSLLLTEIFLQF